MSRAGVLARQPRDPVGRWRDLVGEEALAAIGPMDRATTWLACVHFGGLGLVVVLFVLGLCFDVPVIAAPGFLVWIVLLIGALFRQSRASTRFRQAVVDGAGGGVSPWALRRYTLTDPNRLDYYLLRGRALSAGWTPSSSPAPPPRSVRVAGWVTNAYAIPLAVYACWVGWVLLVAHEGAVGRSHDLGVVRGEVALVVFLVVGATTLWFAGLGIRRGGAWAGVVVVMGAILVVASVGGGVDLAGTASGRADAINGGIVVVAAAPLVLLSLPTARRWHRQKKIASGWKSGKDARAVLRALPKPPPILPFE